MGDSENRSGLLSTVTRGLVHLHSRYYGRGPTRARTYMLDDTVVCFLEGGFTTVEETLIADGNSRAVHDVRRSFQSAMEEPFRHVVEEATGRSVVAYMSQVHTDPNLAVELFVLEPHEQPVIAEGSEELVARRENVTDANGNKEVRSWRTHSEE